MLEVMAVAVAIGGWVLGIGMYHVAVVLREKREREQRRRRKMEREI